MIDKIDSLSEENCIFATIKVVKVSDQYASHLELAIPDTKDPNLMRELLNELSDAFTECKFRLDRVIENI